MALSLQRCYFKSCTAGDINTQRRHRAHEIDELQPNRHTNIASLLYLVRLIWVRQRNGARRRRLMENLYLDQWFHVELFTILIFQEQWAGNSPTKNIICIFRLAPLCMILTQFSPQRDLPQIKFELPLTILWNGVSSEEKEVNQAGWTIPWAEQTGCSSPDLDTTQPDIYRRHANRHSKWGEWLMSNSLVDLDGLSRSN